MNLSDPALETLFRPALLIVLTSSVWMIARRLCLPAMRRLAKNTQNTWDDFLFEHHIVPRLLTLIPAVVLFVGAGLAPAQQDAIERFALAVIIIIVASLLINILGGVQQLLAKKEKVRRYSVTGLIQTLQFLVVIIAVIVVIGALLKKSPIGVLSGLGAMAAILTLAFRETILSFVSGILIQMNDMFREGDWIEIPQMGVDGDLIVLGLHTAKIQNWDKTISTIPTSKLVSEPVKNWRGMQDTGGRRIKRCLFIDQNSIRFLDAERLGSLSKIEILCSYIQEKSEEMAQYNRERDGSISVNKRGFTNIGLFRAYVRAYLKNHPKIHSDLTLLVRQREPDAEKGLPLQIYCFTNDTRWAKYEDIQSDIFDHLYAIMHEFDLYPFQRVSVRSNPSGVLS